MSSIRDPEKRPVYVDRKNGRFFAEPTLGTPWKEVPVGHAYTAGNGLDLVADEFSAALKASGGLVFDGGDIAIDLKANGGVALESGKLAVDLSAASITGTLAEADGGTGETTYSNGQLLIGNASGGLTKATLTAGSNISITNGDGSITITAAGGGAGYTAGDGLDLVGSEFSVDLKANGGLVIEAGEIAVNLSASSITGTLAEADGGTGEATYTNGQLLIGNAAGGLTRTTLTAGANISVTNGDGAITIANTGPALDTAQTWTKGQRGEVTALSDGATIAIDFADSNFFSVTLGGNRQLANPSNMVAGQSGAIFITQDGVGSKTLSYDTHWDFAGGVAPTLSTAANAVDVLVYMVRTSTSVVGSLIKDVK